MSGHIQRSCMTYKTSPGYREAARQEPAVTSHCNSQTDTIPLHPAWSRARDGFRSFVVKLEILRTCRQNGSPFIGLLFRDRDGYALRNLNSRLFTAASGPSGNHCMKSSSFQARATPCPTRSCPQRSSLPYTFPASTPISQDSVGTSALPYSTVKSNRQAIF